MFQKTLRWANQSGFRVLGGTLQLRWIFFIFFGGHKGRQTSLRKEKEHKSKNEPKQTKPNNVMNFT